MKLEKLQDEFFFALIVRRALGWGIICVQQLCT